MIVSRRSFRTEPAQLSRDSDRDHERGLLRSGVGFRV